jgi:serine protease
MLKRTLLGVLVAAAGWSAALQAGDTLLRPPERVPPTDRIIVKWRATGMAAVQIRELSQRTARLQDLTGIALHPVRTLSTGLDVMRLGGLGDPGSLQRALLRIAVDPGVEYVEADERVYALGTANDPRFVAGNDSLGQWFGQWYLKGNDATVLSAINATTAWDTARGAGMRVAVIDSGVRPDHPDLAGQLLPGFDFVCNDNLNLPCNASNATLFYTAGDGSGWDNDPSDPGDGLSASDLLLDIFKNNQCGDGPNHDQPIDSTWHGTRVAGLIAAINDNNIGMASVAPAAKIIPVRTLGKCAGYTSDLVAGMLWAGGISDTGLLDTPAIANRANVLNISLGNRLDCSTSEQAAVDALLAAGVVIVAAAGNDGGPIGAPANCRGVLAVAGVRHAGTKVGYSNVSSSSAAVGIAAPAGNCVNITTDLPCVYSIDTLTNEGKLTPLASNALTSYSYAFFNPVYTGNKFNYGNVGTSFAAPLVSGVVALMGSVNGNLTPDEIIQRIKRAARPFPVPAVAPTVGVCHVATGSTDVQNAECICTTATCGAGLLDAAAAVNEALRPIALITSSASSASIGQRVTVDGSSSLPAPSQSIVGYQWSVSPNISLTAASSAQTQFLFPATRPVTLTLVVTDNAGRQDTATFTVEPVNGASSGTSIGGGGGTLDILAIVLLGSLALAGAAKRRSLAGN